jgi:hypothetical protein
MVIGRLGINPKKQKLCYMRLVNCLFRWETFKTLLYICLGVWCFFSTKSDYVGSSVELEMNLIAFMGYQSQILVKCVTTSTHTGILFTGAYTPIGVAGPEGFRSIVNQKNSYGCEQESQDLIYKM